MGGSGRGRVVGDASGGVARARVAQDHSRSLTRARPPLVPFSAESVCGPASCCEQRDLRAADAFSMVTMRALGPPASSPADAPRTQRTGR